MIEAIAWCSLACVALPALMVAANLPRYRRAQAPDQPLDAADAVDVCIPARNESANIEACVRSVLTQRHATVRALVYDDQSQDDTPRILQRLQAESGAVRAVATQPLPDGWNGKQWGCERMGQASDATWLLFTDADVRFEPDAVAAAVAFAHRSSSDLVSTLPFERCGTVGEALVVPFIHFMLLGYLPMGLMRRDPRPSLAAGCGQFLLVRRQAWLRAGGHAAFRASMHDGIKLPRAVRASGGRTDLFDGTELVSCRMYRGFAQTWRGFAKNAYEGLGSLPVLLFFTALHVMGHVLPWCVLGMVAMGVTVPALAVGVFGLAAMLALLVRLVLVLRFGQPLLGALLHPVGVLTMTAIQWRSLWLARTGQRAWRGRVAGA